MMLTAQRAQRIAIAGSLDTTNSTCIVVYNAWDRNEADCVRTQWVPCVLCEHHGCDLFSDRVGAAELTQ